MIHIGIPYHIYKVAPFPTPVQHILFFQRKKIHNALQKLFLQYTIDPRKKKEEKKEKQLRTNRSGAVEN